MKDYHEFNNIYMGSSDIATLIAVGMSEADGLKLEQIKFGGDRRYTAHYIDEEIEIPNHYELLGEFFYWLKIYDDDRCRVKIKAPHGGSVKIYRSGNYGCLIYGPGTELEEV